MNQDCWAALATEAYQRDWRDDLGPKGELRNTCSAARWRNWLGDARVRYERWSGSTQGGTCAEADEVTAAGGIEDVSDDR